jgi:flagellar L-ring protein precursor FlgH
MLGRPACIIIIACVGANAAPAATADDLFKNQSWASLASDRKAANVGDVITIVVYQNAEARNQSQSGSRRQRSIEGSISGNTGFEQGSLALNSDFTGRGETRRSESFVTQISASVLDVLPNGDLFIEGNQLMKINGETTKIHVRGRVRTADITAGNQVLSTRIADAEIRYDGKGFTSRNGRSDVVGWLFSILGLGG